MLKMIHSMIRVLDEQRSVKFHADALQLKIAHRLDFIDFTLVYLRNAETDFEIELTINKDRKTPYALGDGYGHIAVVTENLDTEHQRMKALGVDVAKIKEFHADGELLARFFFIQDPDGYKIEILEKHGHYR